MRTMHRIGLSALAVALALALGGCGDKKEEKGATQVAAKVNGEEITVHQVNHELAKMGNLPPEQAKSVSLRVVKALVDQQLLVQKALEEKMDRDPQVLQALEAARRQVLSQAYIQKVSGAPSAPSQTEVTDYYNKHPELFAERRIYRLQEINIPVTPANEATVKQQLAQSKSLNDLMQWLKAQNIAARTGQSTKPAEQLPLEILPKLHKLKDGQVLTLGGPGSINLLIIAASQSQPLTPEQAKPVIERFLANSGKRQVLESDLKKLRDKAKIEYLGDYADAGKTEAKAAAPAAPAEAPAAPAQPAAPADQAIEKGLNGLK